MGDNVFVYTKFTRVLVSVINLSNGIAAGLAFVTLQRFAEFIWDWQNTQRLRGAGGIEFGGVHYPAMMLVHAGWLAGLWMLGYNRPVFPAYLVGFLVLEIGRYWVLATLGRCWTTRVIALPGAPLATADTLPADASSELTLYAGTAYLRIQVENFALAWAPGERRSGPIQYQK